MVRISLVATAAAEGAQRGARFIDGGCPLEPNKVTTQSLLITSHATTPQKHDILSHADGPMDIDVVFL